MTISDIEYLLEPEILLKIPIIVLIWLWNPGQQGHVTCTSNPNNISRYISLTSVSSLTREGYLTVGRCVIQVILLEVVSFFCYIYVSAL